MKKQREKG